MNARTRKVLWIAVPSTLILAAGIWFFRDTSSVRYHLRALESLRRLAIYPNCPTRGISRESLNWNLAGRPSIKQLETECQRHENALIELGYFERREFPLLFRNLSPPIQWTLMTLFTPTRHPPCYSFHWNWSGSSIIVTALPGEMSHWKDSIEKFETWWASVDPSAKDLKEADSE